MITLSGVCYLEMADLERAGIGYRTLQAAWRRGSRGWDITKHPADKRRLLVRYDTLKETVRARVDASLAPAKNPWLDTSRGAIIYRLKAFMAHRGLNPNQLSVECGLKPAAVHKALSTGSGLHSNTITAILLRFDCLNANWLLTGRGEMLLRS